MSRYAALPRAFELSRAGYYLDFVLAPLAAIALVAIEWRAGRFGAVAAGELALGALAWSLAEYLIHRFVFHDLPLFRRMHDVHHDHPRDYVGVASWGVFAALAAVWLGLRVAAGAAHAGPAVAGILLAYFFYIAIHDRFHHGDRRTFWPYTRFMFRLHTGHHRGGETNFGVSSPLWDLVLGTYRPAA